MKKTIAVFGMGIIGSRCADNFTTAGFSVNTWNRTPKGRADSALTAVDAAQKSNSIAFYLKDGNACREVFQSIKTTLSPEHVILNHSTIDLETTMWLADQCNDIGCAYLDAPFTGSKMAAEYGDLVYYIGAGDDIIEANRGILEVTSKQIIPMGKVGNATVIKLATNLISASTVQALSEAFAIASAHGIDQERFISAVAGNACGSPLAAMKLPTMAAADYDTHFSLANMLKDARFALRLADQAKLETPGIKATATVMESLCESGAAELDYSALFTQYK